MCVYIYIHVCVCIYIYTYTYIWCRVAAPPQAARPCVPNSHASSAYAPLPSQASRLSTRGVGRDNPQNMEPQDREPQGRGGEGQPTTQGITGPLPFPSPSTQMRMMAVMLCTMTLMCYSQCGWSWYLCSYVALGFGTACALLYLVENRAWLVMFFRKLYRPLSFQAEFRLGSLKVSLSTFLNDFQLGLLSKGPEESADEDHDHHLRHHHPHNIHHCQWLWRSGQVGVQWNCITS